MDITSEKMTSKILNSGRWCRICERKLVAILGKMAEGEIRRSRPGSHTLP